jgi:hypothetical protein
VGYDRVKEVNTANDTLSYQTSKKAFHARNIFCGKVVRVGNAQLSCASRVMLNDFDSEGHDSGL